MHSDQGVKWVVIKSTPIQRTPLLKSLLSERFPNFDFHYFQFSISSLRKIFAQRELVPDGVVAELKNFSEDSLSLFDDLCRKFKKTSLIFILSPKSYSILQKRRRKKLLSNHLLVLSEMKSLDYLAQLPRLIQEVGLRNQLRKENRKLEELVRNHEMQTDAFAPSVPLGKHLSPRSILRSAPENALNSGLKVKIQGWAKIKRALNQSAQAEVIGTLSRMIAGAVRSSDRVLRAKEDEFLVFLSNVEPTQLSLCTNRIQKSLRQLELQANQEDLRLPFSIQTLKEVQYNS